MHGRQAMLAAVGMIFPKVFGKLPAPWAASVSVNPLEAQYQVTWCTRVAVRGRGDWVAARCLKDGIGS
jgi:hypothetical protein